jgi:predicted phage terminase large subunit-like protein
MHGSIITDLKQGAQDIAAAAGATVDRVLRRVRGAPFQQRDPRECPCGARRDDRFRCPRGCVVPLPGPQERFLSSTVAEVLFGGQPGPGKTWGLCLDPLRHVGKGYGSRWQGVLFEREMSQHYRLTLPTMMEIYPRLGARFSLSKNYWQFPAGERLWLSHMENDDSHLIHHGQQYQWIGFDELTLFLKVQYLYLRSRLRSAHGVPCYLRSSTNPGNRGHAWVLNRWRAWLDPRVSRRAQPGEVRHFLTVGETDLEVPAGTRSDRGIPARGRTFIPGRLADNPALANTDYAASLADLDPVTRAQLLDGDWLAAPAAGRYFKRAWFKLKDYAPAEVVDRVRYWDLAGTKLGQVKRKSDDPDWAAGAKVSRTPAGLWVIEHMARDRGTPGDVRALFKLTAEMDQGVRQVIERDPGQAGVDQVFSYTTAFPHLFVEGRTKPQDQGKIVAAGPLSGQTQAGNVAVVQGEWNENFFTEAEAFPEGGHDDQIDAASGAYNVLLQPEAKLDDDFAGGRRRW